MGIKKQGTDLPVEGDEQLVLYTQTCRDVNCVEILSVCWSIRVQASRRDQI